MHPRLVEFTAAMLDGAVRRSDQRVKGELYVPGVMGRCDSAGRGPGRAVRLRRARAGIPDEVRHRETWRPALDMLDEMIEQWACRNCRNCR